MNSTQINIHKKDLQEWKKQIAYLQTIKENYMRRRPKKPLTKTEKNSEIVAKLWSENCTCHKIFPGVKNHQVSMIYECAHDNKM